MNIEPMLETIYDCPVPTIAAVNGPAAGAGANLALCADVVIATESAYFLQAFALIGLLPDAGGTWFMPRQMGLAKAMGASLFADKISARQADDWGLIWEAVADEDFAAHWRKRATYLANGPTAGFAAMKQALRGTYENTLTAAVDDRGAFAGRMRTFARLCRRCRGLHGKTPPESSRGADRNQARRRRRVRRSGAAASSPVPSEADVNGPNASVI